MDRIADQAPSPAHETRIAGYRLLRRIASGDRADVYLAAADRDGAEAPGLVVVRVYDASTAPASIGAEIEAMGAGIEILPGLHDVAALADGRVCLAVERLGPVGLARLLAERRLDPGEAVTILAPLTVGVARLADAGFVHRDPAPADVVFDERGMPRLLGLGALERLPDHGDARRVELLRSGYVGLLGLYRAVLEAVPGAGEAEPVRFLSARVQARPFTAPGRELERALFDWADPLPVAGVVSTQPSRRRPEVPGRMPSIHAVPAQIAADEEPAPTRGRVGREHPLLALNFVPAGLAERVVAAFDGDGVGGPLARIRGFLAARRRPLLFGAALVAVLVAGVLAITPPPAEDGAEARAATAEGPVGTDRADTGQHGPEQHGPQHTGTEPDATDSVAVRGGDAPMEAFTAVEADDPLEATAFLLARRAECFAGLDAACLGEVVQPGSALEAADLAAIAAAQQGEDHGAAGAAPDAGGLAIGGTMGDAVLVVVPAANEAAEASVLVVRGPDGRWRLREIFS